MGLHVGSLDAWNALWADAAFVFLILLVRLAVDVWGWKRPEAPTYIVLASLIIWAARIGISCRVVEDGTVAAYRQKYGHSLDHPAALQRAQTGSILSVVARAFDTTFYWTQCILLLLLYRRFLNHDRFANMTIKICWVVIAVTYPAVILTTFLECTPFHLYWQLEPPEHCVNAYGQLLVQCIANIVIDFFLLIIAFPILRAQLRCFPKNLQLGLMYLLGSFCTVVTCVRLWNTYEENSNQYARTFWASVQAVVAAFVANVPAIYGAAKLFRRRRHSSSATLLHHSTTLTLEDSNTSRKQSSPPLPGGAIPGGNV